MLPLTLTKFVKQQRKEISGGDSGMGMFESNFPMATGYDVQDLYAPHVGLIEDAGGGNIRVYRCTKKGGVLVPVYALITTPSILLTEIEPVKARALAFLRQIDMMAH